METFVALFRGINVGGHNKLPMAELTAALQQLEFDNVRTYIQSGNVVFGSTETKKEVLIKKIRELIQNKFGFDPVILLLSAGEFKKTIRDNPFLQAESEPTSLHLYFLESEAQNPDFQKLEKLKQNNEKFKLINKVFYLYAPDGIGRSKLAAGVEKALGVPVTARNWRTVNKIMEMVKK